MKKTFIAALTVLSVSPLMADDMTSEINSGVIHNYKYIAAGYGYLHDVSGSDISGNGGVGEFSYEIKNIVLGVSGSYFALDTDLADVNLWTVGGSVGYVFRPMKNHLNIIPRFGVAYSEISSDNSSANATLLEPGITLSYALNNRWSVSGGYTYIYDTDSEDDANGFTLGTQFAITPCVGLMVTASFTADDGFSGITAGASWHF